MRKAAATNSMLRSINRSATINLIRQEGTITPSSIASQLNLSMPTVMRIVNDLITEDLVEYDGYGESTGGRPPTLLRFKGDAYAVIGVDLGGAEFFGAISTLDGHIQAEATAVPDDDDGDLNLDRLIDLIERLLAAPRPEKQDVRGIGIGVPGITLVPEGTVTWAQKLQWKNLPLKAILTQRFHMPVYVDNDVNLLALGEWGFGAGQGIDHLVCLVVGAGTGAGILIDGTLYRGHTYSAGELGWFLNAPQLCGRRFEKLGDLESLAVGPGFRESIIDILEQANRRFVHGELGLQDCSNPSRLKADDTLQVVSSMVDYLTIALGSICSMLNPEMVILAGEITRGGELLLALVENRLKNNLPYFPTILISNLGHRAVAMGAIMMVLNATTLNSVAGM